MPFHVRRRGTVLLRACCCEVLERRALLSLSPAGGEFRVNTFTADAQLGAAAARDADGDTVVAWQSNNQDGSGGGIYAQRYSASGAPQGGEFRVNTTTDGSQVAPDVAMDADGDFIIVWAGQPAPGDVNNDIYGQRFTAAGVPQGGEFVVNTFLTGIQSIPNVAADAAGNFVVTWNSNGQDGAGQGVYGQRYDFLGRPQGGEFRINVTTANDQANPSVEMDLLGNFVVAWHDGALDGSSLGVYARRFNAAGAPLSGEFRVNTYTPGNQLGPSVGMDGDGDFVVAWVSAQQDGPNDNGGIYAQRYNAAGVPQGGEFKVHQAGNDFWQTIPSVSMDHDGDFLVAWQSFPQDGNGDGVYARAYSAAGVALGDEFRVNTYTTLAQSDPSVAADDAGNVFVAWRSEGQDGSGFGVYAQRYAESAADTAAPVVGGVFINGERILPYETYDSPLQQIVVSFSENMTDAGGAGGANSVSNPANWLLTRDGANINANISSIDYGYNPVTNRYEATFNLNTSYTSGSFGFKARDNLRDVAGNRLDGDFNAAPGTVLTLPFSVFAFAKVGGEFRANLLTGNVQQSPAVAINASGNFVVVYQHEVFQPGGNDYAIRATRFNAAGAAQGHVDVNTFGEGILEEPAVAMDAAGNFVVVWVNSIQDSGDYGVYGRRFDANGNPLTDEFRVNDFSPENQIHPSIAMMSSGEFVVAFASRHKSGTFGVYVRRYNAAAVPQGNAFQVNTTTTGNQTSPEVTMNDSGNFVIAWRSDALGGSGPGIYAQRFAAGGFRRGPEFKVSSGSGHSIAMSAAGDFVVGWSVAETFPVSKVFYQRFSASGSKAGDAMQAGTVATPTDGGASVAMEPDGAFLLAWTRSTDVYAQRFSASGIPRGAEFPVNTHPTGNQSSPHAAVNFKGDFVIAWEGEGQSDDRGVFAQRFLMDRAPTVATVTDNPDPVVSGNSVTLIASGVADNLAATSVAFYRESNGIAGLQVGAEGDAHVGTSNSPSGGFWSVNASTAGLAAGAYVYWAQATDGAGLAGVPTSTISNVTAPVNPVVVIAAALEFETRQAISITFDRAIDPATVAAGDLAALNLDQPSTPAAVSVILSAGNTVATWVFGSAGTIVGDGDYQFTLAAGAVADANGVGLGAQYVFAGPTVFFLGGDANRDRRVDIADFAILAGRFNQPGTFGNGDFNYDGTVGIGDFSILASKFNTVLPAAAPAGRGVAGRYAPLGWAAAPGRLLPDVLGSGFLTKEEPWSV